MLNDHFEYYTENLKTRIDGNNNAFVFTAGEAKIKRSYYLPRQIFVVCLLALDYMHFTNQILEE